MFKSILLILLLIGLLLLIILLFRKFKNPRLDVINGCSGQNGSGKTSGVICRVIRYLRRIYFLYRSRKYKHDHIILANFPIGKLERKTGKRFIRIWHKKIYCYDLNINILLLQERLPQDEVIIIIDEFSTIASQLDYNNNLIKDNIKEFFRLFRHYTNGKGVIFWLDQCSQEIFNPVRRRTAYCYNYISTIKIWFFPIIIQEYRKILISDEVDNVILSQDATQENDIAKFIFFMNPFKYYDSHCHSNRYLQIKSFSKLSNHKTLKRDDTLRLPPNLYLYYQTLNCDGYTESSYLQSKMKKK